MDNDDRGVGRLVSRREMVALFGASAIAAMAHRVSGQTAAPAQSSLPGCVVVPQQTEGPYFVDERLLRSDIRTDPSTGMAKPAVVVGLRSGLAGWRRAFDAMHDGEVIKSVLVPSM